jgi:uncharacterized protein YabE (DUF348 family)
VTGISIDQLAGDLETPIEEVAELNSQRCRQINISSDGKVRNVLLSPL